MRYYDFYPPYVPVAKRRAKAEKQIRQLQKKHPNLKPVILEGQTLAKQWWGKSWNNNLERYADYSNRIGRGRSYVRHRAVLDLQLASGKVSALVQGSSPQPYKVTVKVDKLSARNWATIRKACEGAFDSLGELLAGQFPQALKDLFFEPGAGLFPTPREIHFDCSCPDWASMCKHVAATLYGVGARLDVDPALFFTLRGINIDDLITQTVTDTAQTLLRKAGRRSQNILRDVDLGDVFGIQLDDMAAPVPQLPSIQPKSSRAKKRTTRARTTAAASTSGGSGPKRPTRQRMQPPVSVAPVKPVSGTMVDALLKAVGRARTGKSVAQLQEKLGWTRTQIRNAISRADAKGFLESVKPGWYRVRS